MDDEQRRKVPLSEKIACEDCRREDVIGCDVEPKASEITDNAASRAAGRVGDELEGGPQLTNAADRVKGARQSYTADSNDAINVEQNALYRLVSSGSRCL
jgi:hypothetical protein